MRRVVSMILILVMLLAAMPVTAMAATEAWTSTREERIEFRITNELTVFEADETCIAGNVQFKTYQLDGEELTLYGIKNAAGEVVWPANLFYYDVCPGTEYMIGYTTECVIGSKTIPIVFSVKDSDKGNIFWDVIEYNRADKTFLVRDFERDEAGKFVKNEEGKFILGSYKLLDQNLNELISTDGDEIERIGEGKYLVKETGVYVLGKGYILKDRIKAHVTDDVYIAYVGDSYLMWKLITEDGTVLLDPGYLKEITYAFSEEKCEWVIAVKDWRTNVVEEYLLPDLLMQIENTYDPYAGSPFSDVAVDSYYFFPVLWAVGDNITAGTSDTTFSPNKTCTRAQILTMLWKAAGKPEPEIDNPFLDLKQVNYFYKPALWAYENGMVSGEYFAPMKPCTRGDSVTYIWKALGKPAASEDSGFVDIEAGSECDQAANWAREAGVTAGTSATTFSPEKTCTRAQIITFLYKAFEM